MDKVIQIFNVGIIQTGIRAREWVQNELISRQTKLYNKDSSAISSTFQVIYFGVDNNLSNSALQYLKQQDLLFISEALTYLKLQSVGWFGELADFLWDKLKKDLDEKFNQKEKLEKEIFLMETKPYFYMTRVYADLAETMVEEIKEETKKVEAEPIKS